MKSETLAKIDKFERDQLKLLLSQCTEKQVELFNRMYKSVDVISKEKIPWAI